MGTQCLAILAMKTWQILLLSLSCCLGDGVFDRLHDDIFHDHRYNPDMIPMRHPGQPVKVNLQLSLLDLEMDRKGSPLEANAWVAMEWEDYRLTWDPSQYEGLKSFKVPAKHLWTPDLEILNAYNWDGESFGTKLESKPGRAVISSNGTIIWFPTNFLEVHCEEASPLDKEDEERRCSIYLGSWTHNANEILLDAYGGNDFLDLHELKKGSEFVVTSQKGSAVSKRSIPNWGDYSFLHYEFKLMKSYIKDPQGNYIANPNLQNSLEDIFTKYKAKDSFVSGWTD